jgi:hypothetical protein
VKVLKWVLAVGMTVATGVAWVSGVTTPVVVAMALTAICAWVWL